MLTYKKKPLPAVGLCGALYRETASIFHRSQIRPGASLHKKGSMSSMETLNGTRVRGFQIRVSGSGFVPRDTFTSSSPVCVGLLWLHTKRQSTISLSTDNLLYPYPAALPSLCKSLTGSARGCLLSGVRCRVGSGWVSWLVALVSVRGLSWSRVGASVEVRPLTSTALRGTVSAAVRSAVGQVRLRRGCSLVRPVSVNLCGCLLPAWRVSVAACCAP